jgi:hypothetical protein
VCKRGDHCRIVNAVLLGWQSDINSLFGAKHDQFSAKMPVSCNATTDKERGRAVILCRKSLACPTKDIDDLVHCGCLETRAEIGDALLREGKRGLRRGAIGYWRNSADGVQEGGLHSAEAEIKRPFV